MYQDGTYDVDYEMNNARALSDMLARIDNARKSDMNEDGLVRLCKRMMTAYDHADTSAASETLDVNADDLIYTYALDDDVDEDGYVIEPDLILERANPVCVNQNETVNVWFAPFQDRVFDHHFSDDAVRELNKTSIVDELLETNNTECVPRAFRELADLSDIDINHTLSRGALRFYDRMHTPFIVMHAKLAPYDLYKACSAIVEKTSDQPDIVIPSGSHWGFFDAVDFENNAGMIDLASTSKDMHITINDLFTPSGHRTLYLTYGRDSRYRLDDVMRECFGRDIAEDMDTSRIRVA